MLSARTLLPARDPLRMLATLRGRATLRQAGGALSSRGPEQTWVYKEAFLAIASPELHLPPCAMGAAGKDVSVRDLLFEPLGHIEAIAAPDPFRV